MGGRKVKERHLPDHQFVGHVQLVGVHQQDGQDIPGQFGLCQFTFLKRADQCLSPGSGGLEKTRFKLMQSVGNFLEDCRAISLILADGGCLPQLYEQSVLAVCLLH